MNHIGRRRQSALATCLLGALGVLVQAGCERPTPDTSRTTSKATATATSTPITADASIQGLVDAGPPQPADWTMADVPPCRFVLLTRRYPLLVELRAMVDGKPFDEASRQAAERVLPYLDQNRDQRVTWDEAAESGLLNARMAAMQLPTGRLRDVLLRSYDADADQTVSPGELVRFFNRGYLSQRWFVVRSADRDATGLASSLARTLDRDGNQQLSDDEIEQAPGRLGLLDMDDDGILLLNEVAGPPMAAGEPVEGARPGRDPPIFLLEDAATDYGDLLFRLQEKYAKGAPLLVDALAEWPRAWQALDTDGDAVIWDDELAVIRDRSPDVTIKILIESRASDLPGQIRFESPSVEVRRRTDQYSEIDLGSDVIGIALRPPAVLDGESYVNSIIQRGDRDGDGQLSASEFAVGQLGIDFQALDQNADELLQPSELERLATIFADMSWLRLEASLRPAGDAIFNVLDTNRDHQLSRSEIALAADPLRRLDLDGDGQVQFAECNAGLDITLNSGQGTFDPIGAPAMVDNPASPASANTPDWFRAMDANHDGEIQRREFLGPLTQFEQADADADGSLSPVEVQGL